MKRMSRAPTALIHRHTEKDVKGIAVRGVRHVSEVAVSRWLPELTGFALLGQRFVCCIRPAASPECLLPELGLNTLRCRRFSRQHLSSPSLWIHTGPKQLQMPQRVFIPADMQPLSHRERGVLEPCYEAPSRAHTVIITFVQY